MNVLLTVAKCTSSTNGGHVLTLKEKSAPTTVSTPFGDVDKSEWTNTFYMKVHEPIKVGFSAELNLSEYNIVERPFTTDDGKDLDLKWLHIK
jgi:hypothetical protein